MVAKRKEMRTGEIAFFAGVLIAILAGVFPDALAPETVAVILVILGIIVGFLNITGRETTNFLIAAIALLTAAGAAGLDKLPLIGEPSSYILTNIVAFVAPAAVIVALKAVWDLARG